MVGESRSRFTGLLGLAVVVIAATMVVVIVVVSVAASVIVVIAVCCWRGIVRVEIVTFPD